MRLTTLVSICSALILAGCSGAVDRPNADAKWINKPALKLVGYNLKTDYDQYGNRLPEAKPKEQVFGSCDEMLQALNVSVCFDPKGQKEVKRSLNESQEYISLLKEKCGMRCWGL